MVSEIDDLDTNIGVKFLQYRVEHKVDSIFLVQ